MRSKTSERETLKQLESLRVELELRQEQLHALDGKLARLEERVAAGSQSSVYSPWSSVIAG